MAGAHLEARQAEVELLNADLQNQIADIDSLLAATLAVDDYIDLEKLRVTPDHPPFTSTNSEPVPTPALPQPPGQPLYQEPGAPTGIASLFGKKKHQQTVDAARAAYDAAMSRWNDQAAAIPGLQLQIMNTHQAAEQQRLERLRADAANYEAECQHRRRQADESNARLDSLIADLAGGRSHAVEEYLTIVFSNSVYPSYFPGVTEVTFDPLTGELTLSYSFPHPDELPTARQYRYVKAKDEITATSQTQKEQRDRYNDMVSAMTLRTLHEAWEADRAGWIRTISFTGRVDHVDPATGVEVTTTLIQLAAERNQFLSLDLAHVTPSETLKHLNANLSKNPHGLVPSVVGEGVRDH